MITYDRTFCSLVCEQIMEFCKYSKRNMSRKAAIDRRTQTRAKLLSVCIQQSLNSLNISNNSHHYILVIEMVRNFRTTSNKNVECFNVMRIPHTNKELPKRHFHVQINELLIQIESRTWKMAMIAFSPDKFWQKCEINDFCVYVCPQLHKVRLYGHWRTKREKCSFFVLF